MTTTTVETVAATYRGGVGAPHGHRHGEPVTVLRPLEVPAEAAPESGPMFLVRFADGLEAHLFADELWMMPPACVARGDYARSLAARHGINADPVPVASRVAFRLRWDAPAASEYAKPVLADAADVTRLRPDLAAEVWHHAAGAIIVGTYCCGTPAAHRDALVALAARVELFQ